MVRIDDTTPAVVGIATLECDRKLMAPVEKVSVALPSDQLEMVRDALAKSGYRSASEVAREALRDWKQKREPREIAIQHLPNSWSIGLASGPSEPLNMAEIKAKARHRWIRTNNGE